MWGSRGKCTLGLFLTVVARDAVASRLPRDAGGTGRETLARTGVY